MLARLQQFTTLLSFGASLAWALGCWLAGAPGWAVGGAVLILGAYVVLLALEFVLVAWVHGDDPAPRASPMQLLRAWALEVITAPRIFCWQQPFRARLYPDHFPTATLGRRGVVLVHGFVCNRGFWNRWLPRLQTRGVPFVAVNLEPVFGSITTYAPLLEQAVQQIEAATGIAPVLVGHSMGGLAIRAWLAAQSASRVAQVITIGSPHRGTWLGRFGMSRNAREMALGTAWHAALAAQEPAGHYARFICFYSHCDNVVFPASVATLPGADNRHLPGAAHVNLVDRPEVFSAVLACVQA